MRAQSEPSSGRRSELTGIFVPVTTREGLDLGYPTYKYSAFLERLEKALSGSISIQENSFTGPLIGSSVSGSSN